MYGSGRFSGSGADDHQLIFVYGLMYFLSKVSSSYTGYHTQFSSSICEIRLNYKSMIIAYLLRYIYHRGNKMTVWQALTFSPI